MSSDLKKEVIELLKDLRKALVRTRKKRRPKTRARGGSET